MKILTFCRKNGLVMQNEELKADVSSKKQTNKFDFTTMIPQVDLFLFVFSGRNWRHQKDISKKTDL